MNPNVGGLVPAEHAHRCAYVDRPAGPLCGEPAQMHLLVRRRTVGSVRYLAACLPHYPVAVASAEVVDAHEFRGWCGVPGARWDRERNECVLDDSGAEPPAGQRTVALESVS